MQPATHDHFLMLHRDRRTGYPAGWAGAVSRMLVALLWLSMASIPAPAADGLVGYWPLDEGEGRFLDELSGHSHAVRLNEAIAWEQTDRGPALRFDGRRHSVIRIDSSPAWDYAPGVEGDLTICFRVRMEEPGFALDHYFGGIPGAWGFLAEGNRLIFSVYLDKPWNEGRKSIKLGFGDIGPEWMHVALVWKRGRHGWVKGYTNGRVVATIDNVPVTASLVKPLYVGARSGGSDRHMTGNVRDLAIFNRTLSAPDIASIYRDGIRLPTPVTVSMLHVDKLLYRPDERARIQVRLRNTSPAVQKGQLKIELVSALQDHRTLVEDTMKLAPRTHQSFSVQTDLNNIAYGCEVRATVRGTAADRSAWRASKSEFFQVSDNIWKVGIGSGHGSGLHTGLGRSGTIPYKARQLYSNYFELFFWSPCDWSLHVAPQKKWWSGQACYPQDEDELVRLIELAHQQGIQVAMYASCNPAGPHAWDVARQHPEWFLNNRGKLPSVTPQLVEQLARWNDPEFRKDHGTPNWAVLPVDLRRIDALDFGIDRIIDSALRYKWDAVRFDGHYTIRGFDEISARNMRRLKRRVWARVPDFRFGFNYGRAPEWKGGVTHEMREGMAGGGLYLQEGIRAWRNAADTYTSWQHYATNELRIAKLIQRMGGHYHCMWETSRLPAAQAYYKFVYGLIAGGHPALYDGSVPLCPSWGAFMTRWSGLLWHPNLRRADPALCTVSDDRVQWRELIQECVVSPQRKFVVLHLVNPPPNDAIEKTKFPHPCGPVTVTFTPPEGTEFVAARRIGPSSLPFDRSMDVAMTPDGRYAATVPRLSHWNMVVWELQGDFNVPCEPPKFTEPPDPARVAATMQGTVTTRTIDPNKGDVRLNAELADNEFIVETNGQSSGVPAVTTSDPDAGDRLAQVQTFQHMNMGHSQRFMGKTYFTPLKPGRYRLHYRIKWTADEAGAAGSFWRAQIYSTVPRQVNGKERTYVTHVASPNAWQSDAGRKFLGNASRYRKLGPPGRYGYYTLDIETRSAEYPSACAIVDTNRDGSHRFYVDHIKVETLEPFSDQYRERWETLHKPADLRTPRGTAPQQFLIVHGVHAESYRTTEAIPTGTVVYDLPKNAAALFAYDAVVLANVDFLHTTWTQRRLLKDFVEAGGRLIVLGGISTLGNGAMRHTYLEALLPVKLKPLREVVRLDKPALIGLSPDKTLADKPAVQWIHDVESLPNASPILYAGSRPIAVESIFGRGKVIVFTGTVLGEISRGKPFWQSASWPQQLRRLTGL